MVINYDNDYNEDDYNYDWNNNYSCNQQNYSSPPFDNSFNSQTQPLEFHHKGTNEYNMLVRSDKYAMQEKITIEVHNIFEARQKAKNMGYEIIKS